MPQYLSISEAAEYLGVTAQTLRRWDERGRFKPSYVTPGGHRQYALVDLARLGRSLYQLALDWASAENPTGLPDDFYCSNSDLFKTRLERLAILLVRNDMTKDIASLATSVAGGIGNNSFDHNLGNWPDVPGVFFAYDIGKKNIVLADRGRGIKKTLQSAIADIPDDREALRIAFTEIVTGRAPEHRGNGLKFVKKAIISSQMALRFQSGDTLLEIAKDDSDFVLSSAGTPIRGCLAQINF